MPAAKLTEAVRVGMTHRLLLSGCRTPPYVMSGGVGVEAWVRVSRV
jgi:hypothetical protein